MKKVILFSFILMSFQLLGQSYHFKVQLNQKDTVSFNGTSPSDYLSSKAILRKTKFQTAVDISDFPITSHYLDSLGKHLKIMTHSKWFNCVVIGTMDSSSINNIKHLPFIKGIEFIGKSNLSINKLKAKEATTIDYGMSKSAIQQVNGDYLHTNNYTGHQILIAVLDAGFTNVNFMTDFAHLYSNNQIVETKNFVIENNTIYTMDDHGTMVLSVLAAKKEGSIVGTAVDANYLLLLTEDVREENLIEEYYWIRGAEYADSLGADIINSSLGYNTFDTPSLDHTIDDLGKNLAPISQGARMASEKGILVVSSAGNEGENSWKYINFPSDESSVLTVGGTNSSNDKVGFSSFGYSGTNSIKPNVSVLGEGVAVSASNGFYTNANGTSFSAPIVAGLAACLWEALPDKNNLEIKTIIEESSHQFNQPDLLLGYGIPNFKQILQTYGVQEKANTNVLIYPNPCNRLNNINIAAGKEYLEDLIIYDSVGNVVLSKKLNGDNGVQNLSLKQLKAGNYLVLTTSNTGKTWTQLILL